MKKFGDQEQQPLDKPEKIESKSDVEKEPKKEEVRRQEAKKEEVKKEEVKKEEVKQEAPQPPAVPEEPAYMKKFRLEQTEGTKEWIAR